MRSAILLHRVEDARHLLERGVPDADLLCTHSGIEVFLRERHGLDCPCLSRFVPPAELQGLSDRVSKAVDPILDELDAAVSPALEKACGLRMRLFRPLYSYLGKYHYASYELFRGILSQLHADRGYDHILCYERSLDDFLAIRCRLTGLQDLLPEGVLLEKVEDGPPPGSAQGDRRVWRTLGALGAAGVLDRLWRRGHERLLALRHRAYRPGLPSALLSEPLYDLASLNEGIEGCNVAYWPAGAEFPIGVAAPSGLLEAAAIPLPERVAAAEGDPVREAFVRDLREDFQRQFAANLRPALALRESLRNRPLSLGVWGNPPVGGPRALAFEFLRCAGIPVLGAQHGSMYGDMFVPWHFDSDFNRCDRYLSYGFDEADLGRLYPGRRSAARIVPVGKANLPVPRSGAVPVDILFPLTNSISLFEGGMTRTLPHELTERQLAILRHLDGIPRLRICAKPFPNAGPANCSVWEILRGLRRVEVAQGRTLMEFLQGHSPRIVVIEYPSTPVAEVLGLDAEVFMMGDPLIRYDAQALGLLRKRVHYFEETAPLLDALDAFLRGDLAPLRDDGYYRRYVSSGGTERKIRGSIDEMIHPHAR